MGTNFLSACLLGFAIALSIMIIAVSADSRDIYEQCDSKPDGTNSVWSPAEEGNFNVQFFVPPRRWDEQRDVPLTLQLEWPYIKDNSTRKKNYVLSPIDKHAATTENITTNFTVLPNTAIRIGWNNINLTWHGINISADIWTLHINGFETEINIKRGDLINITVHGMTSFINCDQDERGFYISSLSGPVIVPFMWDINATQHVSHNIPSDNLTISTYPGGKPISLCQKNDTTKTHIFQMMRKCPDFWKDIRDESRRWSVFSVSDESFNEEDYLVVDTFRFIELKFTYSGEEKVLTTTNQSSVPAYYEEVLPSQGSLTLQDGDFPKLTTVNPTCPVCSCPSTTPHPIE